MAVLSARLSAPDLPAPENKKFYPALDGLRAMAVLMVFCHHYRLFSRAFPVWGWPGVDIFFVLSGFLITGILFDTRNDPHRFRTFYVRRALRIFPLFYGIFLVLLVLQPLVHWNWNWKWLIWPLYVGNYARFGSPLASSPVEALRDFELMGAFGHHRLTLYLGHFWSLCVEEQFYLVWPCLVFLIKDRVRLRNFCMAVCVFCLAARIACFFLVPRVYLDEGFLYLMTPLRADALLFGGLIALMLRGPEAEWLRSFARKAFPIFVGCALLGEMIFRAVVHHFYFPATTEPVLSTAGFTVLDLAAGLIILRALDPRSLIYRVFMIKPLRRLGQMSYGFYIFHDIPHEAYIALVRKFYGNGHLFVTFTGSIGLPCTLLLSYLSFRYFEKPFLRLKDRFAPGGEVPAEKATVAQDTPITA